MNSKLSAVVGVMALAGALGVATAAEQLQEVQVSAGRVVTKQVGHTATGIPIVDATVSYGVSYADLNLAQHADVLKLQGRVKEAAAKACKELHNLYPVPTNDVTDKACAKTATDKAMTKVDELAAAAAK